MILLILLPALLLCASASAHDHSPTHWWSQPTATPTVDINNCNDYYSQLEQCRTIHYEFGPKAQTKTVDPGITKNCSSLAHAWGEIIKSCDFKSGSPTSVTNHRPTAILTHSGVNGSPFSVARTTLEVAKRDPKKKKPKPTCNIEGDSPFDTCGSNKRDYPDSIEEDSIFSGPSPTGAEEKRDPKKKKPKPTCNIEGDSPFESCGSDKRGSSDDIKEDLIISGASPTVEEQKRDPKKKQPKPTCNIENDSPFESCGSDKRDEEDSVKEDYGLAKRGQRCPQDYHFLTAEHDTYHYWFCCPNALDKMLLPESYAAAPKCCKKSDKQCGVDAVDSLDGCDPGNEVTDYGGVKGCRIRATKKDKREAVPGSTGLTAGHDPVTSLGPDSDFHPTTYPTAPADHGQYCHFGRCGKGQVTSYVDDLYCQCVPAPPPTPTTVAVHDPVTGFISDVVGRDVEATHTIWITPSTVPGPAMVRVTTKVIVTVGAPKTMVDRDVEATQSIWLPQLEPSLPHPKTGTVTVTVTIPVPTTMKTSTKQDSIEAFGLSR